jgi:hypothetical protein
MAVASLTAAYRRLDLAVAGLTIAALGGAYVRMLAPGVTWANSGADSGDLIAAAATLGVAHPTGYPTYLLLARLFQLIPLGDLAFRTNLLSAIAAALATLVVYHLVSRLHEHPGWRAPTAAGCAALSLGLSPVFWSQAVVAEVYSLHALFTALILLWTFQACHVPYQQGGRERLRAFAIGLALGNHITIALIAAAWLVAAGMSDPARARIWLLGRRLCWIGLGTLVYLYLPLRAAAHPPVNWGDPHDWAGFWWVVSGRPYRELAFGIPAGFLYGRIGAWATLLVQQFGWVGLGLGFVGLLYGGGRSRRFVWLTAALAAAYSAFALAYDSSDSYTYLNPAYIIFAVWIGLGTWALLEALATWRPRSTPLAAALLLGALLWRAPATARLVDASAVRRAIDFAERALAAASARAIVLTASDHDTFALWYYHYALGQRPDIAVIAEPLLEFAWYRDNLRAIYPALRIPEPSGAPWAAAISAANPKLGPICRTQPESSAAIACGSAATALRQAINNP